MDPDKQQSVEYEGARATPPLGVQLLRGLKLTIKVFALPVIAVIGLGLVAISPVLGIILLPLGARVMETVRRRRGAIVLTYIEQAVRLNLPLPRMLYAAERSEKGKLSMRLRQVRE